MKNHIPSLRIPPVKMLSDRVLVKVEAPERIYHGLHIPDSAQRDDYEVFRGVVVACGPGRVKDTDGTLVPIEIQVGDRVLFHWLAAESSKNGFKGAIKWPDDGCLVMREIDIKAVLN